MARATKCPVCNLFFNRDQVAFVHYKNRYYHKSCYDKHTQQTVQDEKDLVNLEEYIVKLLQLECINARIRKQIKDMKETYNFSYSGIHKSLEYFYEVKGNSISKANGGIGIVPYVYEDAKNYYYTMFLAREQNKGKDVRTFIIKGKSVRIEPPQRKVKKVKTFDLDMIEEELRNEEYN